MANGRLLDRLGQSSLEPFRVSEVGRCQLVGVFRSMSAAVSSPDMTASTLYAEVKQCATPEDINSTRLSDLVALQQELLQLQGAQIADPAWMGYFCEPEQGDTEPFDVHPCACTATALVQTRHAPHAEAVAHTPCTRSEEGNLTPADAKAVRERPVASGTHNDLPEKLGLHRQSFHRRDGRLRISKTYGSQRQPASRWCAKEYQRQRQPARICCEQGPPRQRQRHSPSPLPPRALPGRGVRTPRFDDSDATTKRRRTGPPCTD